MKEQETTAVSRLTKKYQATIPAPVREALNVRQGDFIAFDIERGQVTVRRAEPLDREFARALQDTLGEWLSSEDDEAYRGL